jgi:hypothetical protein
VLGAIAAARRGDTALGRLIARTLPATATVLPNQPAFDWDKIRALPEVSALTTFAVAGYGIKGLPAANASESFPPGDDAVMRTIERPVMPGPDVRPAARGRGRGHPSFPVSFGKGRVGDYLTLQLAHTEAGGRRLRLRRTGPARRGPEIRVRITAWSGPRGSPTASATRVRWCRRFGAVRPAPASFVGAHDSGLPERAGSGSGTAGPTCRSSRPTWPGSRTATTSTSGTTRTFAVAAQAGGLIRGGLHAGLRVGALAAAIFLLGQSIARYISATVAEPSRCGRWA